MSGRGVHELHNRKRLQARQPHGRDCKWSIGWSCLKTPPLQVLWDHMMTQLECCGVQSYTDFTSQVSFPEQHKVQLVDSLALAPTNSVKKELKCRTMTVHFFWVIAKDPQNLNCQLQLLHFLHKALTRRLLKLPHEIFGALVRDSPTHPTSTPACWKWPLSTGNQMIITITVSLNEYKNAQLLVVGLLL